MLIAYTSTKALYPIRTTKRSTSRSPVKAPAWNRAGPVYKLGEAYAQLQRMNGQVFSLWLREDIAEAARKSGDPTRYLARRIRSAFGSRIAGVPEYAFCIEVTTPAPHRPHLHGAIEINELSKEEIKLGLRKAAGIMTGPAAARQLKLEHFDDARGGPRGWARYTQKACVATKGHFDEDRLTYMTSRLLDISRASWNARRNGFS